MIFQPADKLSLILFIVFSIAMFFIILWSFKKAKVDKTIPFVFVGYILAISVVVIAGWAREFVIPVIPLFFVTLIGLTIYLALTKTGDAMMATFSFTALLGFQGFRLPLELILHQWAVVGTIPQTMTWTGQNWDIITGVVSLLSIPLIKRSILVVWSAQMIGFVLLFNVLRVVIMSSPFPFSWGLENPLQLAIEFPYVLIAPLFVAPALFCHLIIFRKLMNPHKNI